MSERLFVNGVESVEPAPGAAFVPAGVAKCPECGGRLILQLTAWEAMTGRALKDGEGVEVDCEREPDLDDPDFADKAHRWWQGEWIDTLRRVHRWATESLSVAGTHPSTVGGGS
jgi:hypothetical protein